eukprot:TRINITY_DN5056_c0_g2_i2.p1 TRINITY_DN5056_c0_g2~~TRINITY_DN5056_c0_g2_i2.p1  ORF type:complete len:467 (+),score=129.71 TRINITY_DN5056_c0_g2_i2:71-1471(+)
MEASFGSVPSTAPNVDALLGGSALDPAFGSGSQPSFDAEKQQRKEQVLARREEMRQKAGGSPIDVPAPVSVPQPQQNVSFTSQAATAAPAALRDDLIRGAVEFLTHPRVANSDADKKRRFLKSKGMTDEEIAEAFKRSGSLAAATPGGLPMAPVPQQQQYAAPVGQMMPQQYQQPRPYGAVMPPPPPPPQVVVQSPSIRALAFIVIICAGIGSAITYLVRRYIIPYFWPKKKAQEEKLEKLQEEVSAVSLAVKEQVEDVRDALHIIKNFLQSQVDSSIETKQLEDARQRQESARVSELKKEIGAIKNLLPVTAFAPSSWKRPGNGPHMGSEFLEDFYEIKGEIADVKRALSNSKPAGAIEAAPAPASSLSSSSSAVSTAPVVVGSPAAAGAAPVERAGSKRGLPAWMQAAPAIPAWQLTDKDGAESGTSSPPLSSTPPQSTTPPRSTTPPPPAATGSDQQHAPNGT